MTEERANFLKKGKLSSHLPSQKHSSKPWQYFIATLLEATCCDRLATLLRRVGCCWLKFDHLQTWAKNTQHVLTGLWHVGCFCYYYNSVAKRTHHVAPNNVATCCVEMFSSFGRGFSSKLERAILVIMSEPVCQELMIKHQIKISLAVKSIWWCSNPLLSVLIYSFDHAFLSTSPPFFFPHSIPPLFLYVVVSTLFTLILCALTRSDVLHLIPWHIVGTQSGDKPLRRTLAAGTVRKLARVVRKPVNANPGLKVNRGKKFYCKKVLSIAYVLCTLRLLMLKTEGQKI